MQFLKVLVAVPYIVFIVVCEIATFYRDWSYIVYHINESIAVNSGRMGLHNCLLPSIIFGFSVLKTKTLTLYFRK